MHLRRSTSIEPEQRSKRAASALPEFSLDVVDNSHNITHNANDGGRISIHYGAIVNMGINPTTTKTPPLPRCPAPSPDYVQRGNLESLMSLYFFSGEGRKCFVLHGLGGSGKTQAALAFADQYFYASTPEKRRFSQVYWVDATSTQTIIESLEAIAQSLGVGTQAEDALSWLSCRTGVDANWLILFNNADDPEMDLASYFPKCSCGNILITTRNRQAVRYGSGPGSDCNVSGMAGEEARDLLLKRARIFNPSPAILRDVAALVRQLDHFPLPVSQAGAFILTTPCTPREYLDMLDTHRDRLMREHDRTKNTEGYTYGSVQATLSINYAQLSTRSRQLLQLCSFMHHEYIKEELFHDICRGLGAYKKYYKRLLTEDERRAISELNRFRQELITSGRWDIRKFRNLIKELQSYSFITFTPDQAILSIHPLVQEWLRATLTAKERIALRHRTIVLLSNSIFLNRCKKAERYTCMRGIGPHLDQILKGVDLSLNGCRSALGYFYQWLSRWKDGVGLQEEFDRICKRVLGSKHPSSLTSMSNLGLTYNGLGRFDEAATLFSQVLDIQQTRWGIDHPDTPTYTHNLAFAYHNLGRFDEAVSLFSSALDARKGLLGLTHHDTLASMNGLGLAYYSIGRFNCAATLLLQTLEAQKAQLGIDHPETLDSMNLLALSYIKLGRFHDAAELFSQTLEIRKERLGSYHSDTLASINNLALAYLGLGRFSNSASLLLQVSEAQKTQWESDHPNCLISMHNLARAYHHLGRSEEAASLALHVLECQKKRLGAWHPDTMASIYTLALAYNSLGRYDDAIALHSQALEARKERLGADHPSSLISMNGLALAYHGSGRFHEALMLSSQAVKAQKKKLGLDHPETLSSMNTIGLSHLGLGHLNDAVLILLHALELRQIRLGTNHPDTLVSMTNLGLAYHSLGRFDSAAELCSRALHAQMKLLGTTHTDTIVSMRHLKLISRSQQDLNSRRSSNSVSVSALRILSVCGMVAVGTLWVRGCWKK